MKLVYGKLILVLENFKKKFFVFLDNQNKLKNILTFYNNP